MAEGFITRIDKHERLEDIGENYLDELVSRFFLEEFEVKRKGTNFMILHSEFKVMNLSE